MSFFRKISIYSLVYFFLISIIFSYPSYAGQDSVIRLSPDESKILRLEKDVVSVIVANPVHASILIDTPRLLVIIPRQPGSTSFRALDSNGFTIAEHNIVVTGANKNHVRVRRSCGSDGDNDCQLESIYYCPDGCYNVGVSSFDGAGGEAGRSVRGSSGSGPSSSSENQGMMPPAETGGE